MLELIKGANLALRFLLELCALGALGYLGFKTGGGAVAKITLSNRRPARGRGSVGAFLSPWASVTLPGALALVLQALVFASAAAGWWPPATEP